MKNKQSRKLRNLRENLKVNLPQDYPWKVLSALADDLSYLLTDEENTEIRAVIRNRDYSRYLALSEIWGPQSKSLEGKTPAEAGALYQVVSLLKKFRFESDSAERKQTAISKFLAAEDACREFNANGVKSLIWAEDDQLCGIFTYAQVFLRKLLGEELPSEDVLTLWSRHGPGANLDTQNGYVDAYHKYQNWPYSCTKGAYRLARSAITSDERWLGALEDDYRRRYNIPPHVILDQDAFWSSVLTVVPGNRITFVPKNSQTDRSIAIEPSMNLYLQLGVDGFIRKRLKRWGVDIDCQKKNRELARLGSLHAEDPENFVTLDLAAASDTISLELCRMLLPREWYRYLIKLRSPTGVLDDKVISYEKISSMGNGYTFALETAIFAAVVYAVQRELLGTFDRDSCAIYGDDIIVKNTIAPTVVRALNYFGFQVNEEKSFFEGPFRESCGADWFRGKPVRPVFLTTTPTSVMELWTDINRLRRFLSLRFMEEESKTESVLDSWIPVPLRGIKGPVSDEDFDSYKHVRDPVGSRERYLWEFPRLVVIPKRKQGKSFLFRKLMHDLRPHPPARLLHKTVYGMWRGCRLTQVSNRFAITKSNSVLVSLTVSASDIWRSEYQEL